MEENLFFENIMIIGPTGSLIASNQGELNISTVRYKLKIKFSQINNPMEVWLYINIPQNIIYLTTYIKNKESGKPLNKIQMEEFLKPLLYEKNTTKTVYNPSGLKPAPNNPRMLSYKWQKGQYKTLLFNLINFYKEIKFIDLQNYMKDKADVTGKTEEQPQETAIVEPQNVEITDEKIKETFDLIKTTFTANNVLTGIDYNKNETNSLYAKYLSMLFLKLKQNQNLSPQDFLKDAKVIKLIEEIKKINPSSKVGKPSKGLIDKNYELFKKIDQAASEKMMQNKNEYFENEIDFFKELKKADLFFENYLGNN